MSRVATEHRRLVVLVPDAAPWVQGAWAREIAEHNGDRFDFAIFPLEEIAARPERFAAALDEAEIVHCLDPSSFAAVAQRAAGLGADHLAWVASIPHIARPADVTGCLGADRIAVMCDEVRDELRAMGVSEGRLYPLRKGVDTDLFAPGERAVARKRLGIPDAEFAIGFAGRAEGTDRDRKGLDVLLAALACVADGCADPLALVVSGPGWAPMLAEHAPPGVAVHYFPFLPPKSMPDLFNAIDLYVSTSRIEGGPLPPFEAMSCGTPVVGTRVGLIRDLVSDGCEALLVPVGDVAATAQAIDRVRSDPDVAEGLGRAGRKKVIARLDSSGTARAAGVIYGSLQTVARPRRSDADEVADDNALRWSSDFARWQRRIDRIPAAVPTRRLRRRPPAGRAAEVAHVDLSALALRASSRILDLGCGAGQLTPSLLERRQRIVSCDLHAPRLAELRDACRERHLPGALLLAHGARLPVAAESFDAVVVRGVLERVEDPERVLDEAWRVLRPGGRLCVSVPSARTERWLLRLDPRWPGAAGHVGVYSREAMCSLIRSRGFRVYDVRGRASLTALFWLVHALAKTTRDGGGRGKEHGGPRRWMARVRRALRGSRLERLVEAIGDRVLPRSYLYYCEKPAGVPR